MKEVHPDAKRRFNDLGSHLLNMIVTFREPPRPPPPQFPNRFASHAVTDNDVLGDVILEYLGPDGRPTGRALALEGGERVGFMGLAYEKLVALAGAMTKTEPFASLASLQFLKQEIFAWAMHRRGGTVDSDVVDSVFTALARDVIDTEVIVPISDLQVQSELNLAGCRIRAFPDSFFEQFESRQIINASEAAEHLAWCRKMRQDFQGFAAAFTVVTAEPLRAAEVAAQRVDIAVGILRVFAPAHFDSRMVSRIDRWGYAPLRSRTVFIAGKDGRCRSVSTSLIDSAGTMVIDDSALSFLLNSGLSEIREIASKDDPTEFEEALLSGMLLFGRAVLTPDLRQRLVWYCAGLESVLLKNSSEGVTQNLAERLAIGAYQTLSDRQHAVADVRAAYEMRSRFMHHGFDVDEGETVVKLARHGLRLFMQLVKKSKGFQTKQNYFDHVESLKLS